MLIVYLLLLLVGFAALIKGADFFVDGSSALAGNFHISKVIIGLTIVAVGTSLPELVTSIVAARKGETGLAVGNVINRLEGAVMILIYAADVVFAALR